MGRGNSREGGGALLRTRHSVGDGSSLYQPHARPRLHAGPRPAARADARAPARGRVVWRADAGGKVAVDSSAVDEGAFGALAWGAASAPDFVLDEAAADALQDELEARLGTPRHAPPAC